MGIKAININRETLRKDPKLWDKVDRGEFQVVYCTPEALIVKGSHFSNKTVRDTNNAFNRNLVLITMDEAHSLWDYDGFRPHLKCLGILRILYPNVPWLATSGTFPPHVVAYTCSTIGMKNPTDIINVNGRRTNINIIVAAKPMLKKDIRPILALIPPKAKSATDIHKTLVFVDSTREARRMAIRLRSHLQKMGKSAVDAKNWIRTYYASIDKGKKDETLKLLFEGGARIVFCTECFSLGVDIKDIEIVIQWGVDRKLNLMRLGQRIGRAARDEHIQGVAVIYAPRALIDPVTKEVEKRKRLAEGVQQRNGDSEWLDDDEEGDWEVKIPNYESRDLCRFALAVEPTNSKDVLDLRNHMYLKASGEKDTASEAQKERNGRKRRGGVKAQGKRRKRGVDTIEPGLLWFLNTYGCRHRQLASYMGFPDIFNDEAQQSWCCDRCAIGKQLDPATTCTHGQSLAQSILVPKPRMQYRRGPRAPTRMKAADFVLIQPIIEDAVKQWREYLLNKLVQHGFIPDGLPPEFVLSDALCQAIAKNGHKVITVEDLCSILTKGGMRIEQSVLGLRSKDVLEMFNLIDQTFAHVARMGKDSTSELVKLIDRENCSACPGCSGSARNCSISCNKKQVSTLQKNTI